MKSPLSGWLGGKSRLAKSIIPLIPQDHVCYCEPFAGAAWILFMKPEEASKAEILNDANGDIVNVYRCLQNHPKELLRQYEFALVSRDEFERQCRENPETLTDIQRASRFLYLLKTCYGGRFVRPTFNASPTARPRFNLATLGEDLTAAHIRLRRVLIDHLGYEACITKYDRPGTFFFLDPPYYGVEDYYGKKLFSRDDFSRLAMLLGRIRGRFLLTLNDVPEVRELFREFTVKPVSVRYTLNPKNQHARGELFIANYKLN